MNSKAYICQIRDLNERGQGVGVITESGGSSNHEGMIAFADGALPGERISGYPSLEKPYYLVLEDTEILTASPDRIENDCPYFPLCGSCQIRHLSYKAELAFKEKRVRDFLVRQGQVQDDPELFLPIRGMEDPFHYRGKSIFPVARDPQSQALFIGQYQRGSHDLVDLDQCHIQSRVALSLVKRIRQLAERDQITAYNETSHEGTLRHLMIRTAFSSGQVMLVFVVNDPAADQAILTWLPELIQAARLEDMNLQSVWINQSETRGNRILSSDYRPIHGSETIEETVNGVLYRLSPDSFFQVNPKQAALLFDEIIKAAAPKPGQRILDLYSGVGAISLQLAQAMKNSQPPLQVTGVDTVAQAIQDARANARINGLNNLTFIEADATAWLEAYEESPGNRPFDVIVVDPPRKGLEAQALDVIQQSDTPRIVYVSCNPATLARDLALLADRYKVERVQPVDLFPRTTHVETIVLLSRKTANSHTRGEAKFLLNKS